MTAPPAVPVGDVQLYDNAVPGMYGGDYTVTVTQDAPQVLASPYHAAQRFTVVAPQFVLPPGEVVQLYPPDGSTGQFADVLPFAVLGTPELPWERAMPAPADPWLAVLVLTDDEIVGGTGTTRTTTTSADEYLALAGTLVPPLTRESDIPGTQPCEYVTVPASVFAAVTPRVAECPYLAHVRVVNTGDKALQGFTEAGAFSVVVGNRFPAVPATGQEAVRSLAHLVSLEGLAPYLVDDPVFTRSGTNDGTQAFATVSLLSLASWTFQTVPDPAEDFAGLAVGLLETEYDPVSRTHHPERIWLRLPPPELDLSVAANAEVVARVDDGYVPVAYHTRSGEDTVAWYRGPIVPVLPAPLAKTAPFVSADAAMAYDAAHGVFDVSLSAAWQVGRLAALADRAFAQALFDFRRRLHLVTDQLADRLARDEFATPEDVADLAATGLLPKQVVGVLTAEVLAGIGGGPAPAPSPPGPTVPDSTPKVALQSFLADPANQAALIDLVATDLAPVATWLARLTLLESLPFEHLVPDPAMLPLGSVRFGYVDPNWVGALVDGATSIGIESSLQTFFHEMTAGIVHEAATAAAAELRSGVLGTAPTPRADGADVVSAMLVRSPLVTGWPNLAVRPLAADGTTLLKTLRMDHLSSGVLLCLFEGVPASVVVAEPQEGFRFGLDEQGAFQPRNLTDATRPVGTPIGSPLPIRGTAYLRDGGRVLDLAPASSTGLVRGLAAALGALGQHVSATSPPPAGSVAFGPAAFALQVLRAPESLTFRSATS